MGQSKIVAIWPVFIFEHIVSKLKSAPVAYFANNIECKQDGTIENSRDLAGVYFK